MAGAGAIDPKSDASTAPRTVISEERSAKNDQQRTISEA
jgi:hypothetical protein